MVRVGWEIGSSTRVQGGIRVRGSNEGMGNQGEGTPIILYHPLTCWQTMSPRIQQDLPIK